MAAFDVFGRWAAAMGGVPRAVYADRHGIYRDEGRPGKPTQFGAGDEELTVELILARSPQAKGRVERRHAVFQDRLVKELRLRRIDEVAGANALLDQVVLRTILDEVDATWRVAGGVYFVLPRRASTGTVRFAALYDRLHRAATRGDRAEIDRLLSPNLARPAPEDPAAWPIFSFPTGVRPARVAVVVAVEGERPEITRLYLDGWERGADGSWWLTSRRPYAPEGAVGNLRG